MSVLYLKKEIAQRMLSDLGVNDDLITDSPLSHNTQPRGYVIPSRFR